MKGPWRNFDFRDVPGVVAFWQRRAREDDGTRSIWYATPSPYAPTDPRQSIPGKPSDSLTDRCLHVPDESLWEVLRGEGGSSAELIWTEGETDARAVWEAGWPAVTHHGGAGSSTQLQANKLRRFRGTVFVAADRDDAGYNCAVRRVVQLEQAGIPSRRIEIIAAADESPHADLRDHIEEHELGLDETVEVPSGVLRDAVERFSARASTRAQGTTGLAGPGDAFYHGGQLTVTDEEWDAFYKGSMKAGIRKAS